MKILSQIFQYGFPLPCSEEHTGKKLKKTKKKQKTGSTIIIMIEFWRTIALENMKETSKGIWKVDKTRNPSQESQSSSFTS